MSNRLSRGYFRSQAKPVRLNVAGMETTAEPKEFSTGSLGWHWGGKTTVMVGGTPVLVQVGVNLTITGSKYII